MKSGKLNFLEPSGPLQACNGIAYIPFRYIAWKWKMSHSMYIIRQLAHGITSIAKVEKYLPAAVITFLS
jgi:hypothetical protein